MRDDGQMTFALDFRLLLSLLICFSLQFCDCFTDEVEDGLNTYLYFRAASELTLKLPIKTIVVCFVICL